MSSLFLKIVNMSSAASWLILAVILLRVVLKKAPKWINVLLWGAVAIRLLCPITIESNLSMMPSAEVFPNEVISGPSFDVNTGFNIVDTQINDYLGDRYFEGVTVPANNGANITTILSVAWIIGIFAFAVFAFVSYRKIHNKVRPSLNVRDNIWICDDIQSPFILGCLKPTIYIPSGTDETQLPHIIAHENAHLKRCDHWWKPLGYLVLAIHWFNPLVWIAYILLCRDIELACDEKVIRELNQSESIAYSEALLSCSVNRRTVMVCPLAFGEVGVKERVKRVLNYKKPAFWIVVIALLFSIVVAVCFLTNPKQDSFKIRITVPAGSQEYFVYSDEEISPTRNQIIVSSGENLGDTEVLLKPIEVKQENAYDEATYLTPGMPVKLDAEKGAWFKVGVNMQNPTDEDIIVYVEVKNVEVRISDEAYTVREWFDYTDNPTTMEDELSIELPEYPGTTFHWYPGSVYVDTGSETIELYTGMPIWNVFFYDLTDDGKPELCSTVSYGSGMIDNRILIYDYAGGASYELEDRGEFDYSLRMENDRIYVDKKAYNSDELVETGYLSFTNSVIEIINSDSTISTVGGVDKPQRTDTTIEAELDAAISSAIMEHNNDKYLKGVFACESHTILATEAGGSANSEQIEILTVYALTLYEEYNLSEEGIESVSGGCGPVALTFNVTENGYELSEYWEPGDGSQYSNDIRKKFPEDILDEVWNPQDYVDTMTAENEQKALEFSAQKGDFKELVNGLLTTICSKPTTSSNPGDYIQANRAEYDELLSYGESTLKFCFTEFLAGGQTELRGQIMAYVCRDIMINMGDDYLSDVEKIYTAQDWFDKFKEYTENMKGQISQEDLEKYHPASWVLLQMINE